jgi:lysophospholipid acyltransferase (LPLAT)-like uncharacterized protein
MSLVRDLTSKPAVQGAVGYTLAQFLRMVWSTSRFTLDPPDLYERFDRDLPAIVTTWHGQHFMLPFLRRPYHRAKVLISRHRDGEMVARASEYLGVPAIRGSGSHAGEGVRKGGTAAMLSMLSALDEGWNVALTADVPKVARVVGKGIIMLASYSQRPIAPVALATSRRIDLNNWDRSTISLPFSRGVIMVGEPLRVPPDPDAAQIEAAREALREELNRVTQRARDEVDGRGS